MTTNYNLRGNVDPAQTKIAQLAVFDDFAAGETLFPVVNVAQITGTVPDFGAGGLAIPDTYRAPNANYPELLPAVSFTRYTLDNHGIIAKVDGVELEAAKQVGFDVMAPHTKNAAAMVQFNIDRQRATLATTASNYPAANQFVNAVPAQAWTEANKATAIPRDLVAPMKAVIRKAGKQANVMVVNVDRHNALMVNDDVLQFADKMRIDPNDENLLARYFGIERYRVANTVDPVTGTDYWANGVVVAYTPENAESEHDVSFGYTLRQYGHPLSVSLPYDEKNERAEWKVKDMITPFLTGGKFGAILTGV